MVGGAGVYRQLIPRRDALYDELHKMFMLQKSATANLITTTSTIIRALEQRLHDYYQSRQMEFVVYPPSKDALFNCREWDKLVETYYSRKHQVGEDVAKKEYWRELWDLEEQWRDEHPKIQLQHADKNTFLFYW